MVSIKQKLTVYCITLRVGTIIGPGRLVLWIKAKSKQEAHQEALRQAANYENPTVLAVEAPKGLLEYAVGWFMLLSDPARKIKN